jgi:hypothetical protein
VLAAPFDVRIWAQDVGIVHDDPARGREPVDPRTIGVLAATDPEQDLPCGLATAFPEPVVHRLILPTFPGIRVLKADTPSVESTETEGADRDDEK